MMTSSNSSSSNSTAKRFRSGFTLLELMLVLTILIAMGAMTAPMLGNSLERQRLNAAAERLRLEFEKTRLKAMKTGQMQVFECTLESSDYLFRPWVSASDTANASAGATTISASGTMVEIQSNGTMVAADPNAMAGQTSTLEGNILFASCLVASDMRSFSIGQQSGGISGAAAMAQMVLFYADGSTSTAEVVLKNQRGDMRAVGLRGLTGSSRVSIKMNVASDAKN